MNQTCSCLQQSEDSSNPLTIYIVGSIATVLSLLYRVPQIYKIYKDKNGETISIWALVLQNVSYGLWITYGVLANDIILNISSCIAAVQNLVIYLLIIFYRKRNRHLQACSGIVIK